MRFLANELNKNDPKDYMEQPACIRTSRAEFTLFKNSSAKEIAKLFQHQTSSNYIDHRGERLPSHALPKTFENNKHKTRTADESEMDNRARGF